MLPEKPSVTNDCETPGEVAGGCRTGAKGGVCWGGGCGAGHR